MKIGDDVLTAALVVGGGIAAYTIYRSFQVGEQTAGYVGTKIDDTQNYITSGIGRITGAPKYFWDGDDEFSWDMLSDGLYEKKKRIKKKKMKKKEHNWFKGLGSSSRGPGNR